MSVTVDLAEEVLDPLAEWYHKCHEASVHLVKSGKFGKCRVAHGSCEGVGGQHSWVILGMDCYDDDAQIIDPTLWSYRGDIEGVWTGTYQDGLHTPHGKGSIWEWGRPAPPTDEIFELTPCRPWSDDAKLFLELLGPLDRKGWVQLAHAPVGFWPAAEIIDAMCESGLEAYVPIDIVGMLTDRHSKLYLA